MQLLNTLTGKETDGGEPVSVSRETERGRCLPTALYFIFSV